MQQVSESSLPYTTKLGIPCLCLLHSYFQDRKLRKLPLSRWRLLSICLGLDNCQLAETQHPQSLSGASSCSIYLASYPTLLSALLQDWKPYSLPHFSEPPFWLLIHPLSASAKQIIALQGKTGVTTDYWQVKEAQLLMLALKTLLYIWIDSGRIPVLLKEQGQLLLLLDLVHFLFLFFVCDLSLKHNFTFFFNQANLK